MTLVLRLVVFGGLFLTALIGSLFLWWSTGGLAISLHGLIALSLACLFCFLLGGGLMFLVFYSSRRGHDDDHHRGPKL